MCDPVTLALVGGSLQTYGKFSQVKSEEATLDFKAKQASANAKVADLRAKDAVKRGVVSSNKARLSAIDLVAEQQAAFAGSGIDVGSGAVQQTVDTAVAAGTQDVLTVQHNAALEAMGFRTEAAQLKAQQKFFRKAQKRKEFEAPLTLLSGATRTGSSLLAVS